MVIFMIHAYSERCFWSLRLLHSLHLLPCHLSDHPAVPAARHLQLPWCRGKNTCVLPLRTLAPWPRTILPHNRSSSVPRSSFALHSPGNPRVSCPNVGSSSTEKPFAVGSNTIIVSSSQVQHADSVKNRGTERPLAGPEDRATNRNLVHHNRTKSPRDVAFLEKVLDNVRQKFRCPKEDYMDQVDTNMALWWIFMTACTKAAVHLGKHNAETVGAVGNTDFSDAESCPRATVWNTRSEYGWQVFWYTNMLLHCWQWNWTSFRNRCCALVAIFQNTHIQLNSSQTKLGGVLVRIVSWWVEDFPKAHCTAASSGSPQSDGGRAQHHAAGFQESHHLHVDVQRYQLEPKRQWSWMQMTTRHVLPNTPKVVLKDIGHSLDVEKKGGVLHSLTSRMDYGAEPQKKWWIHLWQFGIRYSVERAFLSRGPLKSNGGGKTSIHFIAEPDTAELLLRSVVSVYQFSFYGAVADWCEELSQRDEDHPSSGTGRRPVAEVTGDHAQQVPSEGVSSLTNGPQWSQRARQHDEKIDNIPEDLQFTETCADAGFTRKYLWRTTFHNHSQCPCGRLRHCKLVSRRHVPLKWRETCPKVFTRGNIIIGLVRSELVTKRYDRRLILW